MARRISPVFVLASSSGTLFWSGNPRQSLAHSQSGVKKNPEAVQCFSLVESENSTGDRGRDWHNTGMSNNTVQNCVKPDGLHQKYSGATNAVLRDLGHLILVSLFVRKKEWESVII